MFCLVLGSGVAVLNVSGCDDSLDLADAAVPTDAGSDAGSDAALDAGVDAGYDAASDARSDADTERDGGHHCEPGDSAIGTLGHSALYGLANQSSDCPCDQPDPQAACSVTDRECLYVSAYCPDNPFGAEYEFEHSIFNCAAGKWQYTGQDCHDCCRPWQLDAGSNG
jgi:hypothetical protein